MHELLDHTPTYGGMQDGKAPYMGVSKAGFLRNEKPRLWERGLSSESVLWSLARASGLALAALKFAQRGGEKVETSAKPAIGQQVADRIQVVFDGRHGKAEKFSSFFQRENHINIVLQSIRFV